MIETFPLDRANEAFGRSRRHRTFPTKVSDNYIDAMTSGSVRFRAGLRWNKPDYLENNDCQQNFEAHDNSGFCHWRGLKSRIILVRGG
jgi:hypothetical protein